MKSLLRLVCLAVVSCSSAYAQDAQLHAPQSDNSFLGPVLEAQAQHESAYPRFDTPRQLVIRNAMLRAAQRRERMAINARFGYSPSRPPASTMPFMGSPIAPPAAYHAYTIYPGFNFPRPYSRF